MNTFITKLGPWLQRRTPYHHTFRDLRSCFIAGYYDSALRYFQNPALPGHRRFFPINLRELEQPVWIRLGSLDFTSVEEVFLRKNYHSVAEQLPKSVGLVIDLGANVGVTIRLWQHFWPDARIIAVEPDADNMAVCRKNVEAAGRAQRVSLVQAGISARPGALGLIRHTYELGFQVSEEPAAGAETVAGVTMPQLLAEHHIDGPIPLLKCDIEGSEKTLFADCTAWISRVEHLLIELHGDYTIDDLMSALQRNGSSFETLHVAEDMGTKVYLLRAKSLRG